MDLDDFLSKLVVIGAQTPDEPCIGALGQISGFASTDAAKIYAELGSGELCGLLELFKYSRIRPLTEFRDFLHHAGIHSGLVIGQSAWGREILVSGRDSVSLFSHVDWKNDTVETFDTLLAAIKRFFDDLDVLDQPFYCSCSVWRQTAFVRNGSQEALEAALDCLSPALRRSSYRIRDEDHHVVTGKDKMILLDGTIVDGQVEVTFYWDESRLSDARALLGCWTEKLNRLGISRPEQRV